MATYSQLDQAIPPYLAPVLEDVQRRLVQQSTGQAEAFYKPAVDAVSNQTMPAEAVMPVPNDIPEGKANLAILLSNLGATLSTASGVRGMGGVDPTLAFKTVMGRRGEIREVQRENAKNKGIFALEKQRTLGDLAGKQASTAAQFGSDELSRRQRESEFNRDLNFRRESDKMHLDLQKQEMNMRMAIAKLEADTPEKAQLKALAELQANGLGSDIGLILGSLRGQLAAGGADTGSFQIYLPVRDMPEAEAVRAPKDPTTKLPMRLFTSRAAVEQYMEGNFSSLSPLIQGTTRAMWQNASKPVWDELEQKRTAFENDARKRAEAAEAEKIRREKMTADERLQEAQRSRKISRYVK